MTTLEMPERSTLYNLEPIGIGTPYVESLTSYILRLSIAHNITLVDFIRYIMIPIFKKTYYMDNSGRFNSSSFIEMGCINGIGKNAEDWVEAIKLVTSRNDIQFLCMLSWKNVISKKGVHKRFKSWCSLCYSEMMNDDKECYDPLIWTFKNVNYCDIHNRKLSDSCTNKECNRKIPWLYRNMKVGYCPYCNAWLGGNDQNELLFAEVVRWQLFVLDKIKILISVPPVLMNSLSRTYFTESLIHAINYYSDGSVTKFTQNLSISKRSIQEYCNYNERKLPMLESILDICYRYQIPILKLLVPEYSYLPYGTKLSAPKNLLARENKNRRVKKCDLVSAKKQLEICLETNENPPPSTREMVRRINCHARTLYRHFPDLCKKISERYLKDKRFKAKEKNEKLVVLIRSTSKKLYKEGKYPSRKRIEETIGIPINWNRDLFLAWKETLIELSLNSTHN